MYSLYYFMLFLHLCVYEFIFIHNGKTLLNIKSNNNQKKQNAHTLNI